MFSTNYLKSLSNNSLISFIQIEIKGESRFCLISNSLWTQLKLTYHVQVVDNVERCVEDDDQRDDEADDHQVPGERQVRRVLPCRGATTKVLKLKSDLLSFYNNLDNLLWIASPCACLHSWCSGPERGTKGYHYFVQTFHRNQVCTVIK